MPSNALDMALFLESDRMGYLLDVVTPQVVDSQRDVVKNERRQRYENAPYGMAFIRIVELLYPKGHPYSWPGIGYMEDLSGGDARGRARVLQDVLRAGQRRVSSSPATSTRLTLASGSSTGSAT